NLKNRLPLKTNIVKDIFAELGEDTPFSRRQIRDAIAYYTYSYFYQKKIVRGHSRIDLQGNEVEEPSTRHKKYATKLMKKQPVTIKKFGARKISEPARVG
ncbi:MAG: ProQ/FINO family protein, partial [Alphaproteobacteria bacterium]